MLDFAVFTNRGCKSCKYWEHKKDAPEVEQFEMKSILAQWDGRNNNRVCNKLRYKTRKKDKNIESESIAGGFLSLTIIIFLKFDEHFLIRFSLF